MAVQTFTKSGTKATIAAKLDNAVFAVEVKNHELLKQAYTAYLANSRQNLAKTLRRGEVRGGGKKPWKQKGTGRARFGSIRVPIWRGGGITFGPLGNENYTKALPLNQKRTAIRQALTLKAQSGSLFVIEDFVVKDGKTKTAAELLNKIGVKGNVLIAVETKQDEMMRAVRNLKDTQLVQATYLNAYNIINADALVVTQKALEAITAWLGAAKETK